MVRDIFKPLRKMVWSSTIMTLMVGDGFIFYPVRSWLEAGLAPANFNLRPLAWAAVYLQLGADGFCPFA